MKFEYRILDLDFFSENLAAQRTLNFMGSNGWEIIKIFDPMNYTNSDRLFFRVMMKRELITK